MRDAWDPMPATDRGHDETGPAATRRRAAAAIRRVMAPVALLAIIAASVSGAWADAPADPSPDGQASHEAQPPGQHGSSASDDAGDGSGAADGTGGGDPDGGDQPPDSGDSQPPDQAPGDEGDQSGGADQSGGGDQPPSDGGGAGQSETPGTPPAEPRHGSGRYIVVYKDSVGDVDRATREREKADGFKARHRYKKAVKGFAAKLSSRQVDKLEADPAVDFVTPDRRVTASDSVPLAGGEQPPPTGVRRIQAASTTSAQEASGVGVAVIDSGIDLGNRDLNASNGKNCRSDNAQAQDDNGHGTHVAGIIAARNNGAGLVGVAPGTKLYAVKVLDASGNGSWSDVICGIEWVADHAAALDIKVANLSLGAYGPVVEACGTTQDAMHQAICNSTDAGVTYVAAAGNKGEAFDARRSPSVPAAYPEVLAVTAMSDSDGLPGAAGGAPACRKSEYDDKRASFSDFAATSAGSQHTIAAPGVCITSTLPDDAYGSKSGTSMAAPHIAGVVALCLDEGGTDGPCAGKSPADVIQRVRSEAKSHTDADRRYGFKRDPDNDPVSGKYFGYLAWVGVSGSAPPTSAGATLAPTSVAAVKGSIVSGGAGRLAAEDGRFLAVQGGTEAVSWYGQFTGVPTGVSSLAIDYKGHESVDCPQQLSVYDWSSNAYVAADTRSVGTADVKVSVSDSQLPGAAADYVSPKGAVRVLVSCTGRKVTSSGDLMSLAYQAP